jgi:hypothetical protein
LRRLLHDEKPSQYRYGRNYTDIDELVRDLTSDNSYETSYLQCLNCSHSIYKQRSYLKDYTAVGWCSSDKEKLQNKASIQRYLNYKIIRNQKKTNNICLKCYESNGKEYPLYDTQYINELPSVLIFALAPWIDINQNLEFDILNSSKEYILKGIVYSNGNHFTARLVDEDFNVWYHDGQTTQSLCQREQTLMETNDIVFLKDYGPYKAIMAFYVEK